MHWCGTCQAYDESRKKHSKPKKKRSKANQNQFRLFQKKMKIATRRYKFNLEKPIADQAVLARIRSARDFILKRKPVESLWMTKAVYAVVAQVGKRISLHEMQDDDQRRGARMSASVAYRALSAASALQSLSLEHIAVILVHEATHVVYNDLTLKRAGWNRLELASWKFLSLSFDLNFRFCTEYLAYANGARFALANGISAETDMEREAASFAAGNADGALFAVCVMQYANDSMEGKHLNREAENVRLDEAVCRLVKRKRQKKNRNEQARVLRGKRAGQKFMNFMIAREVLIPAYRQLHKQISAMEHADAQEGKIT